MLNLETLNGMQGMLFLARCGVRVEMLDFNKFRVYGFYKSDSLEVDLVNHTYTDRYKTDRLEDWQSLVEELLDLNDYWHDVSKDRGVDEWKTPHSAWVKVREELEKLKTNS